MVYDLKEFFNESKLSITRLQKILQIDLNHSIIGGYIYHIKTADTDWSIGTKIIAPRLCLIITFKRPLESDGIYRQTFEVEPLTYAEMDKLAQILAHYNCTILVPKLRDVTYYKLPNNFKRRADQLFNIYKRDSYTERSNRQFNDAMSKILNALPTSAKKCERIDAVSKALFIELNVFSENYELRNDISQTSAWDFLQKPGSWKYIWLNRVGNAGEDRTVDIDVFLNMLGSGHNMTPKEIYDKYIASDIKSVMTEITKDIEQNKRFQKLGIPLSFYKCTDIVIRSNYTLMFKFAIKNDTATWRQGSDHV